MRKEKREANGTDAPCLVVTYGNTSKRHRPLDADLIVMGRHASCDFGLVSPEVAPVHCVIARVADGWRLRDCSGRPGTRVNGKLIHEALLCDGDIIQVGSFSFETKLPPGHSPQPEPEEPSVSPSQVAKVQRSRKRLVELAWKLRKRVGNRRLAIEDSEDRLVALRTELNQQAALLQSRQRDYDLRVMRLELSERDLATDRATLDKEYRAFQDEAERHATSVRVFNEHVEGVEEELQQKREAVQAELRKLHEDRSSAAETTEERQRSSQKARDLEARSRELDKYAQHLRKVYQASASAAQSASPPAPDVGIASLTASLQVHQDALTGLAGGLRLQLAQAIALVDQLHQTLNEARPSDNGTRRDTTTRRRVVVKKA